MDDHNKQKSSQSGFVWIDRIDNWILGPEVDQSKSNDAFEFVKKGIPLRLQIFWGIIGILWIFKMLNFFIFDLPYHLPVGDQIYQARSLKNQRKHTKALQIHEKLMSKYDGYEKSYDLEIAECYIACSEVEGNFKKGLNLLINKQLSEKQFLGLKNLAPRRMKPFMDDVFSVYTKVKTGEKIYIFEPEILGE